jgi:hypothetical protein
MTDVTANVNITITMDDKQLEAIREQAKLDDQDFNFALEEWLELDLGIDCSAGKAWACWVDDAGLL